MYLHVIKPLMHDGQNWMAIAHLSLWLGWAKNVNFPNVMTSMWLLSHMHYFVLRFFCFWTEFSLKQCLKKNGWNEVVFIILLLHENAKGIPSLSINYQWYEHSLRLQNRISTQSSSTYHCLHQKSFFLRQMGHHQQKSHWIQCNYELVILFKINPLQTKPTYAEFCWLGSMGNACIAQFNPPPGGGSNVVRWTGMWGANR